MIEHGTDLLDPHEALGAFVADSLGAPPPDPAELTAKAGDPHGHLGAFVSQNLGAAPRPPRRQDVASDTPWHAGPRLGWLDGRPAMALAGLAALLLVLWFRPDGGPTTTPPTEMSQKSDGPIPEARNALAATQGVDIPYVPEANKAEPTAAVPATRVRGRVVLGGAEIVALDGAVLHVLARRPDGATLKLVEGALTFAIDRPHSGDWTIHAGPYEVRVVGTAFRLAWSPVGEVINLEVHRGRVLVVDTRRDNKRTLVDGGNTLRLRQGLGWPVISATARTVPDPAGGITPRTMRRRPPRERGSRGRLGPPNGVQHGRAHGARRPNPPPRPARVKAAVDPTTVGRSTPKPQSPTSPSKPVASVDAPKAESPKVSPDREKTKTPEPVKVARLEPATSMARRVATKAVAPHRVPDSTFLRVAAGLTDGRGDGDRPLEVRMGGLGQLSPRWAVGASVHLWTRASDPAPKCAFLDDCSAEEASKKTDPDLHQQYAMAVVTTARFSAWKTQWVNLSLEADLGVAIERWTSRGTKYEVSDGEKQAEPYTAETWLTGTHVALRPVLSVPLGTPRIALTLSGEAAGQLGMAVRDATSSGPATAISPPLDTLQLGGHLGIEVAF